MRETVARNDEKDEEEKCRRMRAEENQEKQENKNNSIIAKNETKAHGRLRLIIQEHLREESMWLTGLDRCESTTIHVCMP